jgi:hypothetical protein
MAEGGDVSVEQVVSLLTRRRARLPFEIGAFVALEACERMVSQGPAAVQPADVQIDAEGHVTVAETAPRASSAEAARSVARVLARLLVAAGHGVPTVLVELVEQGPGGADWDLGRLRDELEASLVPLNRAAARRVLARVLRDAQRGAPASSAPADAAAEPVPVEDVDAELDAFLDGGAGGTAVEAPLAAAPPAPAVAAPPAPPSKVATSPSAPAPVSAPSAAPSPDLRQTPPDLRETPVMESPALVAERTTHPEASDAPAQGSASTVPHGPTPTEEAPSTPGRLRLPDDDDLSLDMSPTQGRGARVVALVAVGLLVALFGVVALVRPDILDRFALRGAPEDANGTARAADTEAERRRMADAQRGRFGHLTVHVEPERAQVLRYVGRGPATAEHLPVGVAHEFVATAEGRLPSRAVIPPDAEWMEGDDPRYELAMQTGEASRHARELDLGASKLPKDMGRSDGALGSVRVITNPPGAKVYHLIGFAPEVEVRDLDTTAALELLIYAEGHEPERMVVGPSDWEPSDDGPPTAQLRLTLEPRRPAKRRRN